jgi:hypothetical protein
MLDSIEAIQKNRKLMWATFHQKRRSWNIRIEDDLLRKFQALRRDYGIRSDRQFLELILRHVLYKPTHLLRKIARYKALELTQMQEFIARCEKQEKIKLEEQEIT